MRWVSTRVLPEPAPATTSSGPVVVDDGLELVRVEALEQVGSGGIGPSATGGDDGPDRYGPGRSSTGSPAAAHDGLGGLRPTRSGVRGRSRAPGRAPSRVGWPGSSTRCSVSTEWAVRRDAPGVARRRVDLDADEVVAELLAQASRSAPPATSAVAGEPQAEHADAVGGPLLDPGQVRRRRHAEVAPSALRRCRSAATAG